MIPRVVEALVELEDIRHGGREVELRNRLVRNAFQVLDDAAQAVAVGDDQDGVVMRQRRQDLAFPVGHNTRDGVAERFGAGQFRLGDIAVTGIETRVARVFLAQRRRATS